MDFVYQESIVDRLDNIFGLFRHGLCLPNEFHTVISRPIIDVRNFLILSPLNDLQYWSLIYHLRVVNWQKIVHSSDEKDLFRQIACHCRTHSLRHSSIPIRFPEQSLPLSTNININITLVLPSPLPPSSLDVSKSCKLFHCIQFIFHCVPSLSVIFMNPPSL